MKKILTVSLFAVMAVSAAHAKIASVEYVDPKFQAINEEIGEVQYTGASLTDAIKTLQTDVGAMSGTGEGSVSKQIEDAKTAAIQAAAQDATKYIDADELSASQTEQNTALQGYADQAKNAAVASANEYTEGRLGELKDASGNVVTVETYVGNELGAVETLVSGASTAIGELNTNLSDEIIRAKAAEKVNADAITAINDKDTGILAQAKADAAAKIADLDVNETTVENGKYFSAYKEEDGKISMEQKAFETSIAADVPNAPTTGAVHTAVEGAKNYTDTAISNLTAKDKVPAECLGNDENGNPIRCALIAVDGALQWEVVEY